MLLYIAVVLDPRYKLKLISYCLQQVYEDSSGESMSQMVKDELYTLFHQYESCSVDYVTGTQFVGGSSKVVDNILGAFGFLKKNWLRTKAIPVFLKTEVDESEEKEHKDPVPTLKIILEDKHLIPEWRLFQVQDPLGLVIMERGEELGKYVDFNTFAKGEFGNWIVLQPFLARRVRLK
ncbi:hypothetical protein LIER_17796 [Lithospermum erythrorhizon]|uniref:hAT-like transposase RNase-H fold domain-containing protein n=1 Tax=Lithospermum erythrorhizon TaxID=34254 RepID=A0AAV3QFU1_LITER